MDNMDLRHFKEVIRKFLFLPEHLIVCTFGFLVVVNAIAIHHGNVEPKSPTLAVQKSPPKTEILNTLKEHFKFKPPENTHCGDYSWKINTQKCETKQLSTEMRSQKVHSFITVLFYMGYVITHIPGALLAQRYGPKCMLAAALGFTTFLTLISSLGVSYYGVKGLLVIRLLMGLSEGPIFPALSCLMAQWEPVQGSCCLAALILNSGHIAILLANLISGALLPHLECSLIFFSFGGCALLWFVSFIAFCFNESESVGTAERLHVQHSFTTTTTINSTLRLQIISRPWREILSRPPIRALIFVALQRDWTNSSIEVELRQLMDDLRKSELGHMFCSVLKIVLSFLLSWFISFLSELLGDILVKLNILKATEATQLITLLATFVPRICYDFTSCLLSHESHNLTTIYNCTMAVMGTYYVGTKLTTLDMDPNYISVIMAIANNLESLANIIAPYMDNLTREEGLSQNMRSFVWLICTIFTTDEAQRFQEAGQNITQSL